MARVLAGSGESLPKWLSDLLLCREMHWTWEELRETPEWLVERAYVWFDVEARWRKSEAKKSVRRGS